MSNDPLLASREITKEIDRLGSRMPIDDWIEFLGYIEDSCKEKRQVAENEIELQG